MNHTGLDHQGHCIRPPSEAYSILLQATLGCSHNKCTFCRAYTQKRFAIKDQAIWERDLEFAARHCRGQNRVFVMDGDAFVMPMRHWEWLLPNIAEKLPWVERVSCYANAKSVALKSDDDLARLRQMGLAMVYYGVESGDAEVLAQVRKGATPESLAAQAVRLKKAGFIISATVIVGLAGPERSQEHAKATGTLLSVIDPDYVGALTLMPPRSMPASKEPPPATFTLPDQRSLLAELESMLEHTTLTGGMFTANHASNYLPLKARLPEDKERALLQIRDAVHACAPAQAG